MGVPATPCRTTEGNLRRSLGRRGIEAPKDPHVYGHTVKSSFPGVLWGSANCPTGAAFSRPLEGARPGVQGVIVLKTF